MTRVALGGRRLLLRVFFHGVFLLALSAAIFLALSDRLFQKPVDREVGRISDVLGAEACARRAHPRERGDVLRMPVPVTIYRDDGSVVLSTARPPLPPTPRAQLATLRARGPLRSGHSHTTYACPDAPPGEYLVLGRPQSRLNTERLALLLVAVLLAVAVASLPLARSIAKPLEEVVDVTRAFGRGDLSARARVARSDDIGDLALAFNDMAERLETVIRAEKEMLANISHELRTPLARIRVVLETAQENPARAQRLLGEIAYDLADLGRLVEDVMAAVRLDLGAVSFSNAALPVKLEPTDVAAVARGAGERFRQAHPARELQVQVADGLAPVAGDARLLRRLVDNLLDNAGKYSEPTTALHLRARARDGRIEVEVEDHGEGIRADDLPHVWTPFFRADRSRSRATGGVGLGLALARRIADAHHAELRIASEPGVGTTVTLSMPAGGAEG